MKSFKPNAWVLPQPVLIIGGYRFVLGEASHEFDKFVEHLLFRHE